jgi:hypothetical protein
VPAILREIARREDRLEAGQQTLPASRGLDGDTPDILDGCVAQGRVVGDLSNATEAWSPDRPVLA